MLTLRWRYLFTTYFMVLSIFGLTIWRVWGQSERNQQTPVISSQPLTNTTPLTNTPQTDPILDNLRIMVNICYLRGIGVSPVRCVDLSHPLYFPIANVEGRANRHGSHGGEETNITNRLQSDDLRKDKWLSILKALKLKPPSRQAGWKFANYVLYRWRGILSSRGGFLRWRLLSVEATAYCPHHCCGSAYGRTATGQKAEYGIVAVDPLFIPLGTLMYIDGYGFAIAADTGKAIKGYRIDLCYPTHGQAKKFGRRKLKILLLRRSIYPK